MGRVRGMALLLEAVTLDEDIKRAKEQVKIAENNFNNADIRYMDVAIYKLNAAVGHLDSLIAERKRMTGTGR
jgi:hypothetical protein